MNVLVHNPMNIMNQDGCW